MKNDDDEIYIMEQRLSEIRKANERFARTFMIVLATAFSLVLLAALLDYWM